MGDKAGQKVYPQGAPSQPTSAGMGGMGMNFGQQQAMVAQQNASMDMMEQRRRERDREARARGGGSAAGVSLVCFMTITRPLKQH